MNPTSSDYFKYVSKAVTSGATLYTPEIDVWQYLVLVRKL
jgi:hypothetical protein